MTEIEKPLAEHLLDLRARLMVQELMMLQMLTALGGLTADPAAQRGAWLAGARRIVENSRAVNTTDLTERVLAALNNLESTLLKASKKPG